ncbi:MAG: hypothetical protein GXY77_01550 [Fibrobacter sp.]|nr:hypothetical protein [Fibrobacter sp.]
MSTFLETKNTLPDRGNELIAEGWRELRVIKKSSFRVNKSCKGLIILKTAAGGDGEPRILQY